jgi:cytochrome d ubiquinol oxidase subunit II
MLYVVLFFLFFAVLLYTLLGGADFGAGILESFSSKKNREINRDVIYRVIGPVWETNHVWLIIVIVVLWVGFPIYFNAISIYLHIPLTLMLLGITIRGIAFVFRHYDAIKDAKTQRIYNAMFRIGSVITPVFIGMTFGALVSGDIELINEGANQSFASVYVSSWFNIFSVLIGVFFAALCAFLAAVFLIGETDGAIRKMYARKANIAVLALVTIGFSTLMYGYFTNRVFVLDFITNTYSIGAVVLSGIIMIPLRQSIAKRARVRTRSLAAIQVILILFAALIAHFPNFIITTTKELSLLDSTAPESVITVIGGTLIVGGLIILPGVFHLFKAFDMIKSFKKPKKVTDSIDK